jgi:hypothetical protein
MTAALVCKAGRLRRGSISTRVNGGSTPHDTPGLAIPSITRGFTPGGHRDSSLYRTDRLMLNV